MSASQSLGEAHPPSAPLPAGLVTVEVGIGAIEDLVEDLEPLEERRYWITEEGRRAWRTAYACERGPTVAEVMARRAQG